MQVGLHAENSVSGTISLTCVPAAQADFDTEREPEREKIVSASRVHSSGIAREVPEGNAGSRPDSCKKGDPATSRASPNRPDRLCFTATTH